MRTKRAHLFIRKLLSSLLLCAMMLAAVGPVNLANAADCVTNPDGSVTCSDTDPLDSTVTQSNDTISSPPATSFNDTVYSEGGNDAVNTGDGDDYIDGGSGADTLNGEGGDDVLLGGQGNDTLTGGPGTDEINGGLGTDRLVETMATDYSTSISETPIEEKELPEDIIGPVEACMTILGLDIGQCRIILNVNEDDPVVIGTFADTTTTETDQNYILNDTNLITEAEYLTSGTQTTSTATAYTQTETRQFLCGLGAVLIGLCRLRQLNTWINYGTPSVSGGTAISNESEDVLESGTLTTVDTLMSIERATLTGNAIDNHIDGSAFTLGGVIFNGEDGNDTLTGSNQNDTLNGGNGDDWLYGLGGTDTLNGNAGNDMIYGGTGNDRLNGGAGNDTLIGEEDDDVLNGNAGTDVLWGGSGNDTLNGGGGIDDLFGEDGDDVLNGGAANDNLYGGTGNDTLNGDNGDDIMFGDQGNDILNGGAGNDEMYGGPGDDELDGNEGNDYLEGGIGNDTLNGGNGGDILYAGDGNDTIDGGAGDDVITGDAGADTIYTSEGADQIHAGADDDTIFVLGSNGLSESAPTFINGGSGINYFQFMAGAWGDLVLISEGTDTLDFSQYDRGITMDMSRTDRQEVATWDEGGGTFRSLWITLSGFFTNLIGTEYDDTLRGNDITNTIEGRGGNDGIGGGGGVDNINGGDQTDLLNSMDDTDGIDTDLDAVAVPGSVVKEDNWYSIELPVALAVPNGDDEEEGGGIFPFIIPVTGDEPVNLVCLAPDQTFQLLLPNGDWVRIYGLCLDMDGTNYWANLVKEEKDTLPADVDPYNFEKGMTLTLWEGSDLNALIPLPKVVDNVSYEYSMFVAPENRDEKLMEMFWDTTEPGGKWSNLPEYTEDEDGNPIRTEMHPGKNDGMWVYSGSQMLGGNMDVITNFYGTLLMVME